MNLFKQLITAALLTAISTSAVYAQDAREAEMIGLHQLCDHNDRKACIKFGMMIQQNHDRMDAWRRGHPEWFWWER